MTNTITREDAQRYVVAAIEANGTAKSEECDIEGLLDALHAQAGDWDMNSVDNDMFWSLVELHAIGTPE